MTRDDSEMPSPSPSRLPVAHKLASESWSTLTQSEARISPELRVQSKHDSRQSTAGIDLSASQLVAADSESAARPGGADGLQLSVLCLMSALYRICILNLLRFVKEPAALLRPGAVWTRTGPGAVSTFGACRSSTLTAFAGRVSHKSPIFNSTPLPRRVEVIINKYFRFKTT